MAKIIAFNKERDQENSKKVHNNDQDKSLRNDLDRELAKISGHYYETEEEMIEVIINNSNILNLDGHDIDKTKIKNICKIQIQIDHMDKTSGIQKEQSFMVYSYNTVRMFAFVLQSEYIPTGKKQLEIITSESIDKVLDHLNKHPDDFDAKDVLDKYHQQKYKIKEMMETHNYNILANTNGYHDSLPLGNLSISVDYLPPILPFYLSKKRNY